MAPDPPSEFSSSGESPDSRDEILTSSNQTLFLSLFARDHQRIFGYIFSQLANRADAEDVFQQTSLVLWKRFDEFDQDREFFPWACGVAFYTVRNFLRVAGRSRLRFSDDLLKSIADERVTVDPRLKQYSDALDNCIQKLSDKDRALIRKAYGGDETIKEIADSLGRAIQTVYNRLNQIRRKLAECVSRNLATES